MHYPVKLILQRVPDSPALEASVFDAVRQLEQFCDYILGCQVFIRGPEASDDGVYAVNLTLRTPDSEITVAESRLRHPEHRNVETALSDAFVRARQELRKLEVPACACGARSSPLPAQTQQRTSSEGASSAPDLHQGKRVRESPDLLP
jgi:hypothetical protein